MKKSDPHQNQITRRKLTKLAGAMAASAAIPPVAAAQNANPVADRQNALDHVVRGPLKSALSSTISTLSSCMANVSFRQF